MSGVPALGAPAPNGLLAALRSWLRGRLSETWKTSEVRPGPSEAAGPMAHFYGSVRVLVVDDNPVNLMVTSALLESRRLVPKLTAEGAEAVALACERRFDLTPMDLQMPILDGLGATAAIRCFETGGARSAVPVVAHASPSPGTGVLATHGMNVILPKHCGDQELKDRLVRRCPRVGPAPAVRDGAHGNSGRSPANRSFGTTPIASPRRPVAIPFALVP